MVIFSLLTINTSKSFQATTNTMVRSDLEYRAISLAQDEIENIRWVAEEEINPNSNDYIYASPYNAITRSVEYGFDDEFSEDYTLTRTSSLIENSVAQNRYKIVVTVESVATAPPISAQLEYIKTYFKE
jgi:hypothetical protein